MGNSTSSLTMKSCARSTTAFPAGIISCSVESNLDYASFIMYSFYSKFLKFFLRNLPRLCFTVTKPSQAKPSQSVNRLLAIPAFDRIAGLNNRPKL